MLTTPGHYVFHVERGDLALLCTACAELPPLLPLEFLVRLSDTLADYFERLSAAAVKAHFVTVYQLLEEMCDSGVPTTLEANVLKELIPPPGRAPPPPQPGPGPPAQALPWRRAGCRYASNEVFFDLVESLDATLDADGRTLFSALHGELFVNSRLSGMPDLTLSFANHGLLDDVRFHPCVRFARFAADRVLSFVPPDGGCKLMSYSVREAAGRGTPPSPMYVKPQFSFSAASGRVSLMLGPRGGGGGPAPQLEAVSVRLPLPRCVASLDVSANVGAVGYDEKAKLVTWDVGRVPADKVPLLSGVLQLDRGREGGEGRAGAEEALCVEASFKVSGSCISGLAVDALHLANESIKLYKGVRYTTQSGRFVVRV